MDLFSIVQGLHKMNIMRKVDKIRLPQDFLFTVQNDKTSMYVFANLPLKKLHSTGNSNWIYIKIKQCYQEINMR